jgi:hypothetical protein
VMTRKKVTVYSSGQMDVNTRVAGSMVNNTEQEHTAQLVAKLKKDNGRMERESNGLMKTELFYR